MTNWSHLASYRNVHCQLNIFTMHDVFNAYQSNPYFKVVRNQSGLSIGDVAAVMGCRCQRTIARLETNERRCTLALALGYQCLFNLSPQELLHNEYRVLSKQMVQCAKERHKELSKRSCTAALSNRIAYLEMFISSIHHV